MKLASSAYLLYSAQSAGYIANGGFLVSAPDGSQRIYGTYANAAKASQEGKTITLLHDYTGSEAIKSGNAVSTLDLDGHTYTYTGSAEMIDINYDGAGLVIKNGSITGTAQAGADGVTMLWSGCSLELEDVTLTVLGEKYGIVSNGNETNNTVTLKNSTLNAADGFGIYFPCSGSVSIEDSVINAKYVGVQLCAGSLEIRGDKTKIAVTGDPQQKTENDGVIADGAAVSIVERDGYKDLGTVKIEDGTFTAAGESATAIKAYTFSNTDKTEGTWEGAGDVIDVSGGSFSSAVPEEYCADNFHPNKNADGTYSVHIHKKDEGTVTKPATASETGTRTYKCSICGEELGTEVIPALGSGGEENGEAKPGSGSSGSSSSGSSSSAQKSAVSEINSASTGDDSEILPWLLVLLVSAAGIASGLICQRKLGKRQKK